MDRGRGGGGSSLGILIVGGRNRVMNFALPDWDSFFLCFVFCIGVCASMHACVCVCVCMGGGFDLCSSSIKTGI